MAVSSVRKQDEAPVQHLQLLYCDSCTSARATHRVWVDRYRPLDDGSFTSLDLVLCGHHINKHMAKLLEEGYEVEEM